MSKDDNAARLVGDRLVRNRDGAVWSNLLGDWVIPRRRRSGVVIYGLLEVATPSLKTVRVERVSTKYTRVKRSQSNRSALRARLAEAQNWRCCYCGEVCDSEEPDWKPATFEHVVELSKGGADNWDNLVMACYDCNDERGNKMTAEEFYRRKQNDKR